MILPATMEGCTTPPQNIHILISRTCEYVTLPGTGDFADAIK